MAVAISSQMATSLAALAMINDGLGTTGARLSSGKSVQTASDNAAVYFRARAFSNKSEDLDTSNSAVKLGMSNITLADRALTKMQDNLGGTLSTLKDARAKAVTLVQTVSTNGNGLTYMDTQQTSATPPVDNQVLVRARPKAAINGPNPVPAVPLKNINDSSMFQEGDTFAMTLTDSATNTSTTRYFRAARATNDPTEPGIGNVPAYAVDKDGVVSTTLADGKTEVNAFNFKDFASLANAINLAYGSNEISASSVPQTNGGNKFKLSLLNPTQSVTFAQQTNNDPAVTGTPPGTVVGATFDFSQLLGNYQAYDAQGKLNATNPFVETNTNGGAGAAYRYAPTSTVNQSALDARRQAADTLRATLVNLRGFVADAALPGANNLLKGETMSVDLNETGDVKQVVKLANYATNPAQGVKNSFDPLSFFNGFQVNGGVVNSTSLNRDFNNDADLDNAVAAVNTYLASMKFGQNYIASQNTMMQSRYDFNKENVAMMKQASTDMTASDVAEEAANQSALSTRQNFAVSTLAMIKQNESGLIQLLR